MLKNYRNYRRFGFNAYRSALLAFWDLPVLRNL